MRHDTQVPAEIMRKWQEIVDLLADIVHVPAALITRVEPPPSKSRSIVEDHGGRLWAAANVPEGAAFQFTVPIDPKSSSWSAAGPNFPTVQSAACESRLKRPR